MKEKLKRLEKLKLFGDNNPRIDENFVELLIEAGYLVSKNSLEVATWTPFCKALRDCPPSQYTARALIILEVFRQTKRPRITHLQVLLKHAFKEDRQAVIRNIIAAAKPEGGELK